MSIKLTDFGGVIEINGREAVVRPLTYRRICEQSSWALSESMCPVTELRIFLTKRKAFRDPDFAKDWIKIGRRSLFFDNNLQHMLHSSIYGRMFDIWQATSASGITQKDIRQHLENLDGIEAARFFGKIYAMIAIANNAAEISHLSHATRMTPVGGKGIGIELFFAKMCGSEKSPMDLDALLDSTPSQIRTITTSTEEKMAFAFADDVAEEMSAVAVNDIINERRYNKIYTGMAKNLLEGKRIDTDRPKPVTPSTAQPPVPQPCKPSPAPPVEETVKSPESPTMPVGAETGQSS